MKSYFNWGFVLVGIFAILSCSANPKDNLLEKGTFKASITGDIENKLSGNADYSIGKDSTFVKPVLFLSLDTGQFVGSGFSTGIFLNFFWEGKTGTFSLGNTFIVNQYVPSYPYAISYVDGSVTINKITDNTIKGIFNLTGERGSFTKPDATYEYEISGEFIAERYSQ